MWKIPHHSISFNQLFVCPAAILCADKLSANDPLCTATYCTMVIDQRLDNILRILLHTGQADPNCPEISRVYASAATVLATLTNPLNVSLLTTQILVSPAIWHYQDGMLTALRIFGVFQSATLGKIESPGLVLGVEDWLNSLVKGANQNVPRWKHLLLLGAVLCANQDTSHLSLLTRKSVEAAFCRAANLSLLANSDNVSDDFESDVVNVVLAHTMQNLSHKAKSQINYDALLPTVVKSIYFSRDGFQSGYFLPIIDHDMVVTNCKLAWPCKSNSFLQLQERSARPLFISMSGLAMLAGSAIQQMNDASAVYGLLDRIQRFSDSLVSQWKSNRLSAIPMSEEAQLIDEKSLKTTIPVLWQILKTVLFTTTHILQELTIRVCQTPQFCGRENGPVIASKILQTLRGHYFVTSRMGNRAFAAYNFIQYAAIDLLTSCPDYAEKFIASIVPTHVGQIPILFSDRVHDLYYLNLCEQVVPVLSPKIIADIILPSLSAYLVADHEEILHSHFEAAHSVVLAILTSVGCTEISRTLICFYVDSVFKAFPSSLSARQFRLAFRILVTEASYLREIPTLHPYLADVLLEVLCTKISLAATSVLSKRVDECAVGLSEKDVCILAVIDSLACMRARVMLRWLDTAAKLLNEVQDVGNRRRITGRFWEVLSSELDIAKAEVVVRWWGDGGRWLVFVDECYVESGLNP
ncbi:hypothetical protein BDD12DRAFT_856080 [Trichophaea hybrida]|nr:hypothetical protein BDD12DRAFT_856080 [Trichophaea hybrida]